MRITFDISPSVHKHAGLGRYAENLLAELTCVDKQNQYRVFHNRLEPGEQVPSPVAALPRTVIPLSARPWRMSVLLADLFHAPMDRWIPQTDLFHGTDHLLPPFRHARTVFTLHDLIFHFYPEYHLPLNRWFLKLMMPRFLRQADAVIAVSECTRRDAIRLYQVPEHKITVVYEGVHPGLGPTHDLGRIEEARLRLARNQRFIFFLSTIEPRKNLTGLVDALAALRSRGQPHRLLAAGRKGWLYQGVFDHIRRLGLESEIDFLDFVPDTDLSALFAACDVFVFPSLYEGFGLPPLEAMASGAPVVASNTSSLPEILGDAALFVDPRDPGAMADAIERVGADPALREELRGRGFARAAHFSWEGAARETLAVYEHVMHHA